MTITIYHNPRCSKSRQSLALLEERDADDITIIRYLETAPSEADIRGILKTLNVSPREIMRTKEAAYKEQNLGDANDEALIQALVNTPALLERPIILYNGKGVIGRPPENVHQLF